MFGSFFSGKLLVSLLRRVWYEPKESCCNVSRKLFGASDVQVMPLDRYQERQAPCSDVTCNLLV
jgi:hypothetical protein